MSTQASIVASPSAAGSAKQAQAARAAVGSAKTGVRATVLVVRW